MPPAGSMQNLENNQMTIRSNVESDVIKISIVTCIVTGPKCEPYRQYATQK